LIDLFKAHFEGNVENFSREFIDLLDESYRNKPIGSIYKELREMEFQFSSEVAKLTEVAIMDPSKAPANARMLDPLLKEATFPYKTSVKLDIVKEFLLSTPDEKDFEASFSVFKNFIANKSLGDLQTIQVHFSGLNIVDLAKSAINDVPAEEIRQELLKVISVDATTEPPTLNIINPEASSNFSDDDEDKEGKKKKELLKDLKGLKEGAILKIDLEELKDKDCKVLSIDDNSIKITDGKEEYTLTVESKDDLDKIKVKDTKTI
jgi:hypothetical protein